MAVSLYKPFSLLLGCFSLIIQDDVTAVVCHGQSHEVLIRLKSDVNLQTKVGVVTDCSVCGTYVCYADIWYMHDYSWLKFIGVSVNLQTVWWHKCPMYIIAYWGTSKIKLRLKLTFVFGCYPEKMCIYSGWYGVPIHISISRVSLFKYCKLRILSTSAWIIQCNGCL